MRKLSKEEKIELKYGDPFLKQVAGNNYTALNYYSMYVDAQRQIHWDTMEAFVSYAIAMVCVFSSLWHPLVLASAALFTIVAVQAGLNARIERLWAAHFASDLITCVDRIEHSERLSKLESKNGKN